jgi:hypothetical protein
MHYQNSLFLVREKNNVLEALWILAYRAPELIASYFYFFVLVPAAKPTKCDTTTVMYMTLLNI